MGRKRHHHHNQKAKLSSGMARESNEAATNIDSLPEEMLIKIFGFLKHNDLCQIARVCRQWNTLTRYPPLWKKVDMMFRMYYRYRFKAAKTVIEKLPCFTTYIKLDFRDNCNWFKPLNFKEFSEMLHKKCPNLETLILQRAHLSDDTLWKVIDLCTQFLQKIKVLVFHYSVFANYPIEEKDGDISKIEVLDVSGCFLGHYNRPPFSRMPHLKKLYLAHSNTICSWFQDASFLKQLEVLDVRRTESHSCTFEIIQNHGLHLKELYLCGAYLQDEDLIFNHSAFPSLEIISLKFNYCITCDGVISLIQSCPSLCHIYVCVSLAESFAIHPFVVANKSKFENIQVSSSCFKQKGYLYP